VKFVRHLAAATLVVAVVVILGLAWNHFAASTLIGNLQDSFRQEVVPGHKQEVGPGRQAEGPRPGPAAVAPGTHPNGPHGPKIIRLGTLNLGLNSMLDPVNLPYLRHTVVIEAGVIAAVVIIDAGRRKSRRARRAGRRAWGRARWPGPRSEGQER
jgi:hypothetical protein